MNEFMLSGIIVGLLAILFWTPYLMSKGVVSLEGSFTAKDRVIAFIPFVNIITAEKRYLGKIGFCTISVILLILGITSRVIIWWNFYDNVTLGTASIAIFWIVIALYLIANILFVRMVISDARAARGIKLLLLSVAYPFGQYYVGAYLGNVIRHMQKKEETFKR